MFIAKLFHSITILLWVMFVSSANLGIWASIAIFLSSVMLTYEHYLVNKDFTKIDKAFLR